MPTSPNSPQHHTTHANAGSAAVRGNLRGNVIINNFNFPAAADLERDLKRAQRHLRSLQEEAAECADAERPAELSAQLAEAKQAVASLQARLGQLGAGAAPAPLPDNLPARAPIFVGRTAEQTQCLAALLPEERGWGVTLDGMGGMGKTALALEVAHLARQQALFDAYLFVSAKTTRLTPEGVRAETLAHTSLDAFVREFARLLGLAEVAAIPEATPRRLALLDALRGRRTLFIWDNLETLTNEERALIAEFLRKLPGANKALLTSRRRTGESALTVRLDKLEEAAAMALMADLGQRYPGVGAALKAPEAGPHQQALYEAAGGNPLVLQFALGLVEQRGYSLPAVVARVRDAELAGDLYGFLFADAARAMTPTDKTILTTLSGFLHPITLTTLAEVAALSPNPVQLALERLVALSLVNPTPDERYALPPLARTYAASLDPAAQTRPLRYWVEYAQRYGGDDKEAYLTHDRLAAEWPNLEATALALRQQTGAESAQLLIDLASAVSNFLWLRGYWDERIRINEWAYAAAQRLGLWRDAGWAAYRVAFVLLNRAETEAAGAWAARMAEAMGQGGGPREKTVATRLQGIVAHQRGDHAEAERHYAQALKDYRALGDANGISLALNDLGNLARIQGHYDRAEAYYREALALAERGEHKELQASYTISLGLLALDRHAPAHARPLLERGLAVAQEVGQDDNIATAQAGLAQVWDAEGRYGEALACAEAALRIRERLRDRSLEWTRALVARLRGK